jgi:hypothetical protein
VTRIIIISLPGNVTTAPCPDHQSGASACIFSANYVDSPLPKAVSALCCGQDEEHEDEEECTSTQESLDDQPLAYRWQQMQSNSSLLHDVLPADTLPSGTPSGKRARAACSKAEGSLSEDETIREAYPDEQPAAVRLCRQLASVQTGAAPFGSVEGTPAGPVVHSSWSSSHRSVRERMLPAAEPTTAYGKEPGPTALAQHDNFAPGNYSAVLLEFLLG